MFRLISTALAIAAMTPFAAAAEPLVIDADTTLAAAHAGPIVIAADGVTLDCAGFMVQGDGIALDGITVEGDDVTVRDCYADDFARNGIRAVGVERLTVEAGRASRAGAVGIQVTGGAGHTLSGLVVTVSPIGVQLDHTRDLHLSGLLAEYVGTMALRLRWGVEATLEGVVMHDSSARGVAIVESHRTALLGCEIVHPDDRGVYVVNSGHTAIEDCEVRYGGSNGYGVHRSTNTTVSGSRAIGNANHGFSVAQSTVTVIEGGESVGNGGAGYRVSKSALTSGAGNVASQNGAGPLLVEDVGAAADEVQLEVVE